MRRSAILMMLVVLVGAACGDAAGIGTGGGVESSTPTSTSTVVGADQFGELAAALDRWNTAAPDDYTVTQVAGCDECDLEPATLAVHDGEVVSLASTAETIEEVFTTIEESLRAGADVEVQYHPDLGYPVRVVIDLDGDGGPDVDLEHGSLESMPIVRTLEELLAAQRRWEAQQLDSYRYIFRADCTCPDGGTFQVDVSRGAVVAIRPLDAAAERADISPGSLDAAFEDLAEWFIDSSRLQDEGFLEVDVRMDPVFGYPRWFRVVADIDDEDFAGPFTMIVTIDLVAEIEPVDGPAPDPRLDDLEALEAALATWNAAEIADYDYVLTIHCECDPTVSGPFAISVRGGDVVRAVFQPDGADAEPGAPTIDELLETIASTVVFGTDVAVDYDPDRGFPTFAVLDPEAAAVDGGLVFSITDFVESD